MAISNARATATLSAIGAATRTNVSGQVSIGVGSNSFTFTDADIAYSWSAVSSGSGDAFSLDMELGDATATSGSPALNDEGTDFEGKDLATMATVYAILIQHYGTGVATVSANLPGTADISGAEIQTGGCLLWIMPDGVALSGSDTLTGIFSASGGTLEVTVIGKTA